MTDELWNVVGRVQRERKNYVPIISDRDALIEQIGRLQRELDTKIEEHAINRFRQQMQAERDRCTKRNGVLERRCMALKEQVRQLRIKYEGGL